LSWYYAGLALALLWMLLGALNWYCWVRRYGFLSGALIMPPVALFLGPLALWD
jgi:hypothetical protein